jgi:hypothetical protein
VVAAPAETPRQWLVLAGFALAAAAVVGWVAGTVAWAAAAAPSMEVLPKRTGLEYSQTVEIKAHHLPKGSGSVAATICGLNDASGKTIAKPTADDCAGASEIGKLVIVKSWQSNGEFDTKYTLPKSGQKFGKHARFCDKKHYCALVVADANPNAPAYHVDKKIQFVDQASGSSKTKPKKTPPKSAASGGPSAPAANSNSSTQPSSNTDAARATANARAGSSASASSGSVSFGVAGGANAPIPSSGGASPAPSLTPPATGANPVPAPVAQGLDQVCTRLADAVKQAGGDASALLAACSAIESGNGPQQLATVLQSPSLLCIEGASAWQNNAQVTDACNQAAAGIAPATSQIGGVLGPVASGS